MSHFEETCVTCAGFFQQLCLIILDSCAKNSSCLENVSHQGWSLRSARRLWKSIRIFSLLRCSTPRVFTTHHMGMLNCFLGLRSNMFKSYFCRSSGMFDSVINVSSQYNIYIYISRCIYIYMYVLYVYADILPRISLSLSLSLCNYISIYLYGIDERHLAFQFNL